MSALEVVATALRLLADNGIIVKKMRLNKKGFAALVEDYGSIAKGDPHGSKPYVLLLVHGEDVQITRKRRSIYE